MDNIAMNDITGYVSADELVELADAPESLAAGWTPALVTSVVVGASAAMQGGCPTSGCTTRC